MSTRSRILFAADGGEGDVDISWGASLRTNDVMGEKKCEPAGGGG